MLAADAPGVDAIQSALSDGQYFVPPGELRPKDFAARVSGAPLLECDALWEWIRADDWPEHAIRHGDPTIDPLLSLMLGRRLLSLDTRLDPTGLLTFWNWFIDHQSSAEPIRNIWSVRVSDLRETVRDNNELGLVDRIDAIRVQERRFIGLLKDVLEQIHACAPLRWASHVIRRLIARRGPSNNESIVRMIVAWSRVVDKRMRPATLIELDLADQHSDGVVASWISPAEMFKAEFHKTLEAIASVVGCRQLFSLKWHRDPDDPLAFAGPISGLTGSSGGLAIHVAQSLANRRQSEALDPWVVLSARLDMQSRAVEPVDGLASKLAVLRQEGIRIVGLADDEDQIAAAKGLVGPGIVILPCRGSVDEIVSQLRALRMTHPVDLHRLKAARISRRTAVGLISSGTITAAAGGAALATWALAPQQTLAMVHHQANRLNRFAKEYQRDESRVSQDRTMYEAAAIHPADFQPPRGHRYTYLSAPPAEHPQLGLLEGFDVLENSVVWDSHGWVPVTPEDLHTNPVEPALVTRAVRLLRLPGHPANTIATFELNCTGFGAVILPDCGVGEFNIAWTYKRMKQASEPTKSYYMSVDVSHVPEGKEFLICTRSVVFNSCQDQTCRGRSHDWWGFRLYPNMHRASLAVRLPRHREYADLQKKKRFEGETEWRQVDARDDESAGESGPSYNAIRGWTVWSIPLGTGTAKAKTVYSIQWKWKTLDHPGVLAGRKSSA
jgi:hypothetical protein